MLFGDELMVAEGTTMDMDDMVQLMSFVSRHVAKDQHFCEQFGRALRVLVLA